MLVFPMWLVAQASIFTPHTETQHFVVPNIWPCTADSCHSLEYDINYDIDHCVTPVNPHVVQNGREISFTIIESGERGRAGYSWTLLTTEEFSGDVDFTVTYETVSNCRAVT